jgi:hypothetical protein
MSANPRHVDMNHCDLKFEYFMRIVVNSTIEYASVMDVKSANLNNI